MKIFGKEINKKVAVASIVGTGIIGVCVGYGVVSSFMAPSKPSAKPSAAIAQTQAKTKAPTAQKPNANNQAKNAKNAKKTEKSADTAKNAIHIAGPSLEDLLRVNPFVELHSSGNPETTSSSTVASNMPLPAIPGRKIENNIMSSTKAAVVAPSFARGSVPLPAIPRNSSVPVPSSKLPSSVPSASSNGSSASVQGVLTGDDGNNIAILSDGRVVETGDMVGSDRISYIGGDGIQLDNGHSIDYK